MRTSEKMFRVLESAFRGVSDDILGMTVALTETEISGFKVRIRFLRIEEFYVSSSIKIRTTFSEIQNLYDDGSFIKCLDVFTFIFKHWMFM